MKVRKSGMVILLIASIMMLVAFVPARRANGSSCKLAFRDGTAICRCYVATNKNNNIQVEMSLLEGGRIVNIWTSSDEGSVAMEETVEAQKGKKYTLKVKATSNGKGIFSRSVSKKY